MPIIPTIRCRNIKTAAGFYTSILDFELVDDSIAMDDPSFCVLARGADRIFLSSHSGDGAFGQAIVVLTDEIDALFKRYLARGLVTPGNPDSPVHEGPLDQSWGTREFYVNDPDGNTLRFVQQSQREAEQRKRAAEDNLVDAQSEQSFPASDPPSWTLGSD